MKNANWSDSLSILRFSFFTSHFAWSFSSRLVSTNERRDLLRISCEVQRSAVHADSGFQRYIAAERAQEFGVVRHKIDAPGGLNRSGLELLLPQRRHLSSIDSEVVRGEQ